MPGEDPSSPEPDPRSPLALDVVDHAGDWTVIDGPARLADAAAAALARRIGPDARGQATVVLADDAEIRRLNAQWRGKDKSTNVLSFPSAVQPGDCGSDFLGDVILALETIAAEASDLGIPISHHYQHLVVHGLLHLLGYDHEEDAEAREMEGLETEVLAVLGIPDPYRSAIEQAV